MTLLTSPLVELLPASCSGRQSPHDSSSTSMASAWLTSDAGISRTGGLAVWKSFRRFLHRWLRSLGLRRLGGLLHGWLRHIPLYRLPCSCGGLPPKDARPSNEGCLPCMLELWIWLCKWVTSSHFRQSLHLYQNSGFRRPRFSGSSTTRRKTTACHDMWFSSRRVRSRCNVIIAAAGLSPLSILWRNVGVDGIATSSLTVRGTHCRSHSANSRDLGLVLRLLLGRNLLYVHPLGTFSGSRVSARGGGSTSATAASSEVAFALAADDAGCGLPGVFFLFLRLGGSTLARTICRTR